MSRIATPCSPIACRDAPAGADSSARRTSLAAYEVFFEQRSEFARKRQRVLVANPPLMERELIKLTTFAAAMAGALRERGASPMTAQMAAETGVVALRVAFTRWAADDDEHLIPLPREAFADLRAALVG